MTNRQSILLALKSTAMTVALMIALAGVAEAKPGAAYYSSSSPLHAYDGGSDAQLWGTFNGYSEDPSHGSVMKTTSTVRIYVTTPNSNRAGAYSSTAWYDNATACYVSDFSISTDGVGIGATCNNGLWSKQKTVESPRNLTTSGVATTTWLNVRAGRPSVEAQISVCTAISWAIDPCRGHVNRGSYH
jgi:hypothetical protein